MKKGGPTGRIVPRVDCNISPPVANGLNRLWPVAWRVRNQAATISWLLGIYRGIWVVFVRITRGVCVGLLSASSSSTNRVVWSRLICKLIKRFNTSKYYTYAQFTYSSFYSFLHCKLKKVRNIFFDFSALQFFCIKK